MRTSWDLFGLCADLQFQRYADGDGDEDDEDEDENEYADDDSQTE